MRLVVISSMAIERMTCWRNLAPPIEDTLGDMPDVTVLRPPALRRATFRADRPAWLNAIRTVRRADTVFWTQMCLRPPIAVWALGYVSPLARRSVLAIDVWEPDVQEFGRLACAQRFNPVFNIIAQSAHALSRDFPSLEVRALPTAYNRSVFRDLGLDRDIDVFWMGRRDAVLHDTLRDLGDRGEISYRYLDPPDDPIPTEQLNELISRSRYFMVTPPDVSDFERTGSFSPLAMRYLEGIAAGARLVGVSPRSGELERVLGRHAIVECAIDGSDLQAVLRKADDDPNAEARRVSLRDSVQRDHTWQRRALDIYSDLVDSQS